MVRAADRVLCSSCLAGLALLTGCQSTDRQPVDSSAATSTASTASAAATRPDTSTTRRKILFAGTSLTAGYGLDPDSAYSYMIQRKIDSAGLPYETVNAGVSGETTAGLLQRLDWLLRGDFDVLVIESGANDGLRGVAAGAIKANLTAIVERARAARPAATVLLVQMEALPNYGRNYGTAFHDLYVEVARAEHITLLPFLLDGVAGIDRLNQNDGIHPTAEGARIVADHVWAVLEPVLRKGTAAPRGEAPPG
jgi:acyl-CoA thioesterase-1